MPRERLESSTRTPRAVARRAFAIVALTSGAIVATLPGDARAQDQDAPRERGALVKDVVIRGVERMPIAELRSGIVTQPSRCKTIVYTPICWVTKHDRFYERHYLDALELRRDALRIRLYYWRRGYRDTRVTTRTDPAGNGVRVTFDVAEGPPTVVEALEVRMADSLAAPRELLPPRVIDRALQLKAGDPLDMLALDSSATLIREELWDRGFADARVTLDTARVSNTANRGPVAIDIRAGTRATVGDITIQGNSRISERTVRKLLTFQSGDVYRRSDVLESQRNLYLSGLFREVDVPFPLPGDSVKAVELHLAEGDLRRLDLTAGFSTADFLQLETVFTRFNFLGGARRLTLRATLANLGAPQLSGKGAFYDVTNGATGSARNAFLSPTWALSADLVQPWLFSAQNQLGTSIFAHRRTIPGVVVDRGHGATLALTRDHGPRASSTLGYTYESATVEASDVYFCVTFGACVSPSIRALSRGNPLAPIALTTLYDRSNDALSPTSGWRGRFELEHASAATLSDFRYNRASGTAATYFRTTQSTVLAGRVRLGWVNSLSGTARALRLPPGEESEVVHPRKRFFAGGAQSVRGFGENQLGPRVLTIAPEKLTVPPDSVRPASCTLQQVRDGTCDPNAPLLRASDFQPQPLGGTSLAEASIEFRFPLPFYEGLQGAVFVDGALIGTDRFSSILGATGAITPGFGVRLGTPIGPVRLDLGVRPTIAEDLPVITQVSDSSGGVSLITLKAPRRYDPIDSSGNILRQILARLTLHLSVGPAF